MTPERWRQVEAVYPSGLGAGLTLSPDQRELLYSAINEASGDDLLLLEFQ